MSKVKYYSHINLDPIQKFLLNKEYFWIEKITEFKSKYRRDKTFEKIEYSDIFCITNKKESNNLKLYTRSNTNDLRQKIVITLKDKKTFEKFEIMIKGKFIEKDKISLIVLKDDLAP